jgi:hypothetical protein
VGTGLTGTEARVFKNLVNTLQISLNRVDLDALAFISSAGITDPIQTSAITTLVSDLKNYNLWNKLKIVYPFIGGTSFSHKFNLIDPQDNNTSFRLNFSGSWTHSSTGIKGNGSTTYANTYFLPNSNLSFDNQHYCVYKQTNVTSKTYACDYGTSLADGPNSIAFYSKGLSSFLISINDNFFTSSPTVNTNGGLYTLNRIGATRTLYRNNTTYQAISITPNNSSVPVLHIGARNDGSNPARDANDTTISFFSAGDGLTDTEAANLYTVVQKFQTTLGRQV